MKRILVLIFAVLGSCYPISAQNIEGQIIASQYGQWRVQGYAPDTYNFAPTSCRVQGGASFFPAFKAGTPILIVDGNPGLSEVVTPTSVALNNTTCSITINPVHHHNVPFYLTSATGGIQEAINANVTDPDANTIILNNAWYQMGGTAGTIAEVQGTANLGLVDITTLPSTWYRWNGMEYVAVTIGSAVSSVFGRTGSVIAEAGDYTCAEVTGCLTSAPVTSVFGRVGAVVGITGDYDCLQVTNCVPNAVSSVFGRTGAITAEAGDYTCVMVTGCAVPAATNAIISLTAAETSTATTASVNVIGVLTAPGYVLAGSEWEYFASETSLGNGNYTLNGIARAQFATLAAAHSSGTALSVMIFPLSSASQSLFAFVGGEGSQTFLSIGCPTGTTDNGGLIAEFGCPGVGVGFDTSGFTSWGSDAILGSLFLGNNAANTPTLDYVEPLVHGSNILQNNYPNSVTSSIAFPAGIPGGIKSVQAPVAPAPVIYEGFVPSGTTTNTYVCTGTDELGGNIPGTSANIFDLAASDWGPGYVGYNCIVPGAVATSIYRTAGGPNQGLLATADGAVLSGSDAYTMASDGTPSAANTSIPHLCLGGTLFCILYGTTGTPPVGCSSATAGWEYHDIAATSSPYVLHCVSGASSWATAY